MNYKRELSWARLIMHPPFRSRRLPVRPTQGFPPLRPRHSGCLCSPFGAKGQAAQVRLPSSVLHYVLFRIAPNDAWEDAAQAHSDVERAVSGPAVAAMSIASEELQDVGGTLTPGFSLRKWWGRGLRRVRICGSVHVASCYLCG